MNLRKLGRLFRVRVSFGVPWWVLVALVGAAWAGVQSLPVGELLSGLLPGLPGGLQW